MHRLPLLPQTPQRPAAFWAASRTCERTNVQLTQPQLLGLWRGAALAAAAGAVWKAALLQVPQAEHGPAAPLQLLQPLPELCAKSLGGAAAVIRALAPKLAGKLALFVSRTRPTLADKSAD